MTRCSDCGRQLTCPACTGARGGSAKVKKGFASAEVLAKALATRKAAAVKKERNG